MTEAIKVTVTDPETGTVLDETILDNDFVVICAGRRFLASSEHHASGTDVLTIKTDKGEGRG